MQVVTASS